MTAVVHIHISNPRHQRVKSSTLAENPAWYDNITQDTTCQQRQEDFTAFTTESIAISYWRKHMHMQLHEKSLENRASGLAVAEEATRFRLTPIGAC